MFKQGGRENTSPIIWRVGFYITSQAVDPVCGIRSTSPPGVAQPSLRSRPISEICLTKYHFRFHNSVTSTPIQLISCTKVRLVWIIYRVKQSVKKINGLTLLIQFLSDIVRKCANKFCKSNTWA